MIEELYGQLYNELVRWVVLMTENTESAEEVVQEGFLRAIENAELLEDLNLSQRRSWLYRTIKNLWIDRVRKNKREQISDEETMDGLSPGIFQGEFTEKEWQELLEKLPGYEGAFLVMRYVEGYNSAQIGEMMKMPSGTVRSILSSARKHIREML